MNTITIAEKPVADNKNKTQSRSNTLDVKRINLQK